MNSRFLSLALTTLLLPANMTAQYVIYPTPQQQVAVKGHVTFSPVINVVCEKGIDLATQNRAQQILTEHGLKVQFTDKSSSKLSNIYIGIAGSRQQADRKANKLKLDRKVFSQKGKFDRHLLALTDAGKQRADVIVLGEHTNAAFHALASLEQMLDLGSQNLPCTILYDFADQKSRGLVEGYYGYPYTLEVKKDLMRFLMRHKMNTYLYGAKSDPYHSQYWKEPYPTQLTAEQQKHGWLSQSMVSEVSQMSQQTKVNFIWAIHPGDDFVYKVESLDAIMGKFEQMHQLGVRQFAVFVDDVSVPSKQEDLKANADHLRQLQTAIEKKWNTPNALPADTVRPLHFVPQIYCTGFAPDSTSYGPFFKALSQTQPYITVYSTGADVWSVPNSADLESPKKFLGRDVAWWWNYPCNDNADGQLFTLDTYSNFKQMPAVTDNATLPATLSGGLGLVSNPMQQGEVSKIALFSVANYAWNTKAFDNIDSWKASFKAVIPGNTHAQEAFLFLAPYLSFDDTELMQKLTAQYQKNGQVTELKELLAQIEMHCNTLVALKESTRASDRLLYNDLAPWLLKLKEMASVSLQLLDNKADSDKGDKRWETYMKLLKRADALATAEDFKAYALEGMGNNITTSVRQSQPSQKSLLPFVDYLKVHALDNFMIPAQKSEKPCFTSNTQAKGLIKGNLTLTCSLSENTTLKPGDWVGIELPAPTIQTTIASNSKPAGLTLAISENGKCWKRIDKNSYNSQNTAVRYAILANTSKRNIHLKANNLPIQLTLPEPTKVAESSVTSKSVWADHSADKMHDGDYSTFCCPDRGQQVNDAYTVKLAKAQPIHRVRLAIGTTNGDYMKEAVMQISADGKHWTNLRVLGTQDTIFSVDHPQMEACSYDANRCDFDGEGRTAQYVRMVLRKLNDGKWLRVYELDINGNGALEQPQCTDGMGVDYPQANDGSPATSTAKALKKGSQGELIYRLNRYQMLKGVTIYGDETSWKNTKIEVTRDGKKWQTTSVQQKQGVMRIDLSNGLADAIAIRLVWTGEQTPAIHEVVEHDAQGKPALRFIK